MPFPFITLTLLLDEGARLAATVTFPEGTITPSGEPFDIKKCIDGSSLEVYVFSCFFSYPSFFTSNTPPEPLTEKIKTMANSLQHPPCQV